jgi:hypothetical protein
MANASFARSTCVPTWYALAIGGFDVPEDVPGVDDGLAGGAMTGCPSPGVRFVEQPNAAKETVRAETAIQRRPPFEFCLFLRIFASCLSRKSSVI